MAALALRRAGIEELDGQTAGRVRHSSGQGASLAVESAVQPARCLRDLPYPSAFTAYEALRRDRVDPTTASTGTRRW